MNENEDNFEALRRLLALKRHEVPPPGYFETFSGQVIAHIRAGQRRQSGTRTAELPWLLRLVAAFESKPVFAGGFASVLCLLLLLGIVYAERPDAALQPVMPVANLNGSPLASVTPASLNPPPLAQTEKQPVWGSSTNPVFNAQPVPGWFSPQPAAAQFVSFRQQ